MGVRGTTAASVHVGACRHGSEEDCSLAIAVERADGTILERMLQEESFSGAKIECLGFALQTAALRNLQLLAGLLVARGADINFEGGTYETALGAAILGGHQSLQHRFGELSCNITSAPGLILYDTPHPSSRVIVVGE
jgi:hypothetical protein